jgi:hypothetical protein
MNYMNISWSVTSFNPLGLPFNSLLFPFFFIHFISISITLMTIILWRLVILTKMYNNSPPFPNNHGLQISCLIVESFPLTPKWFLIPSQCSWTTLWSNSTYFRLNTTTIYLHLMSKVHQKSCIRFTKPMLDFLYSNAIPVATPLWPSVGVKPNTWKSWGFGVLRDSRMFRAQQQGPKHLNKRCSWCRWKGLET